MKKISKTWLSISVLLSVSLIISEAYLIYTLLRLDILPSGYLAAAVGAVLFLSLVIIILFYIKSRKAVTFIRTVAVLLALIMISGSLFGAAALSKLRDTFTAVTDNALPLSYFGFYVKEGDSAVNLSDAGDYIFGICSSFDRAGTDEAMASAAELLGKTPETKTYDDIYAMLDGLESGDIKAAVLNEAYLPVISDAEGYGDFASGIRPLYRYGVQTPASFLPPPPKPDKDPLKTPFLMYLSGTDTYYEINSHCRSDVNILAAINPETKEILLISTPRDYFVPNPAADGAPDKLTHMGIYGVDCSAKALSDLYRQPVSYTARINFTGFEKLIDAIGGVNIYSETGDGIYLSPGDNFFDGKLALQFARDRSSYAGGDRARGQHQMQLIKAMLDKLVSASVIKNYSEIMDSVQGLFITDMPKELITEFIRMQLSEMPDWDIQSFSVDGQGGQDKPYSLFGAYAYVMYPDNELVDRASTMIDGVLNGKTADTGEN